MSPEDIDKLTIAEVRAIAERASEALKTLQQLGLAPLRVPISADANLFKGAPIHTPIGPVAASPFPCPVCGRAAPEKPNEACAPEECLQCGNHMPLAPGAQGVRVSNKGPLVMDSEMLARRQALISAPAFDGNGEPT